MLHTATPERITGKRRRSRQPQPWRLGRNRQVIRQTWRVCEDPATARPIENILASGWTAADAADLAREVAEFFADHGYDKTAGCWWARDDQQFHRFVVTARKPSRLPALALTLGISAAFALIATRRPKTA
jgi:hypothetical protein